MNRNFLRIILTLVAVSSHYSFIWCVHAVAAEGSWFDGMEFEEYHPSGPQDDSELKGSIQPTTAWRIPCGLIEDGNDDPSVTSNVLPLSTVIDLNSSTSTIQESFLQSQFGRDELFSKLMMSQDDQTNGTHVIPSGSLWLRLGSTQATVLAPKLEVVVTEGKVLTKKNKNDARQNDDDSIQLRLGLDFLSMYQGRLDVAGAGGLFIVVLNHEQEDGSTAEEVLIPIMQPRSPINHEDL